MNPISPSRSAAISNCVHRERYGGPRATAMARLDKYRVVAEEPMVSTPKGPMRRRAGWAEIAVSGEQVTGVFVPIGFGAMVRGRVEIDDGDPATLADPCR